MKVTIKTPKPFDILCGKGSECNSGEGNRRYRLIIDSYRERYASAHTRHQKCCLTIEIHELLNKASSRFLKFNSELIAWEEVPYMAARDKIGHALRFANRTKRRGSPSSQEMVPDILPSQSSTISSDDPITGCHFMEQARKTASEAVTSVVGKRAVTELLTCSQMKFPADKRPAVEFQQWTVEDLEPLAIFPPSHVQITYNVAGDNQEPMPRHGVQTIKSSIPTSEPTDLPEAAFVEPCLLWWQEALQHGPIDKALPADASKENHCSSMKTDWNLMDDFLLDWLQGQGSIASTQTVSA